MNRFVVERREGGGYALIRFPSPGSFNEPIAVFGADWHEEAIDTCNYLNERAQQGDFSKNLKEVIPDAPVAYNP